MSATVLLWLTSSPSCKLHYVIGSKPQVEWERGRRAITNQNLRELHIQKFTNRDFKIIWSSLSLDNILERSGLREEEVNVQPTKSKRRQTGETQVNWLWYRDWRVELSKDRMLLMRICLPMDLKVPSPLDHQDHPSSGHHHAYPSSLDHQAHPSSMDHHAHSSLHHQACQPSLDH